MKECSTFRYKPSIFQCTPNNFDYMLHSQNLNIQFDVKYLRILKVQEHH